MKKTMVILLILMTMLTAFSGVGLCQQRLEITEKVPVFCRGQVVDYVTVGRVEEVIRLPEGNVEVVRITESKLAGFSNGFPVITQTITYSDKK